MEDIDWVPDVKSNVVRYDGSCGGRQDMAGSVAADAKAKNRRKNNAIRNIAA